MKTPILGLLLASSLALPVLALAPVGAASAQAAAPAAQGSPSKMVLDNSQRILSTLESRRAEFTKIRGALEQFVSGEFNAMFDRDYAARQVLGRHARGVV